MGDQKFAETLHVTERETFRDLVLDRRVTGLPFGEAELDGRVFYARAKIGSELLDESLDVWRGARARSVIVRRGGGRRTGGDAGRALVRQVRLDLRGRCLRLEDHDAA